MFKRIRHYLRWKRKVMKTCIGYLDNIHSPDRIRRTVDMAAEAIKSRFPSAQAIAFRGMSGAAIGYPLAYKLEMPVLNVRKKGVESHSLNVVEGSPGIEISKYVIVDDLIDSGSTIEAIVSELMEAECIGIVLYANVNQYFRRMSYYASRIGNIPVESVKYNPLEALTPPCYTATITVRATPQLKEI